MENEQAIVSQNDKIQMEKMKAEMAQMTKVIQALKSSWKKPSSRSLIRKF